MEKRALNGTYKILHNCVGRSDYFYHPDLESFQEVGTIWNGS